MVTPSIPDDSDEVEELLEQREEALEHEVDAMRGLLDAGRFQIIQQLIASDTGALSVPEIMFRSDRAESTIRAHLSKLEEDGYVTRLEPTVETVPRDMPSVFYTVTPKTLYFIRRVGLWDVHGMLYQLYDSLERTDKVAKIEEWDGRPIPEWTSDESIDMIEDSWY